MSFSGISKVMTASAALACCVVLSGNVWAERAEYNFNAEWRLAVADGEFEAAAFDDSSWEKVTLPHAWNEDDSFAVEIHDHSTGIAWYRKTFVLPEGAETQKVFLEFEGVRQGARVYVNGQEAGRHHNGVMAFGLDISSFVKPAPAENVVAVRTDNDWKYRDDTNSRFQWSDANFNANYGGIPKNVQLHITPKVYQTLPLYSNLGTVGVYVYADHFNIPGRSATIHTESEVRNETQQAVPLVYQVVVKERDGTEIGRFESSMEALKPGETRTVFASFPLKNLQFWSWGYGYLYDVYTTLVIDGKAQDTVCTRTGFRKTEAQGGMFLLNDRVLQIKGYAQRTSNEWPALGLSPSPWLSDFSNRMMVESGGNTVRWMHITPSKQDVESCDRVGLMMLMPAGDSEKDVTGRRWEQRTELMRDALIYNRNNPSVVFLESGNKGVSEEHMAEMKALRDQYAPHSGFIAGSREMLGSDEAEWGGEMLYINKSGDIPLFATEYCRDEGLRKYWDEWSPPFHKNGDGPFYKDQPAPAYNHNQDSFAIEDVTRWYDYWEARPGTGRRVSSGGLNIVFSDSNTHKRGAENYRRSGEVDPMRIPKDAFYAHQVMWNGWVDPAPNGIHIIGHWNYAPGTVKPVYVVSSAEQVGLFLNGKLIGKGERSRHFLFTFPEVKWAEGTLRAVGFDAKGHEICSTELSTAGAPAALKLTHWTAPSGLHADGADVALVQVEVVDVNGQRCPNAMNTVDFDLEGAAEWRGGLAQGREDNYILAKSLPVECGVNRVFIRSKPDAGAIKLTACSEGLKPATLELKSNPVAVSSGLSSEQPDAELPVYLDRGPTPGETTVQWTRRPVSIVSVKAGSNEADAELSLDDNEETKWKSSGDEDDAWITYKFDQSQPINQVCLKLDRWRNTSYPIKLMVGKRVIWSGPTPCSLGYVTLSFEPIQARELTISMGGATKVDDAFGQIVEVTGAIDQSSASKSGSLAIVEAEIYGPRPNK